MTTKERKRFALYVQEIRQSLSPRLKRAEKKAFATALGYYLVLVISRLGLDVEELWESIRVALDEEARRGHG